MKRKLYAELIILILLALCAVSACGAAESDTPEEPDYLQIAVDVVREQYPGIDPMDETEYCLFDIAGLSDRSIEFTTKSIQHGGISVDVSTDGKVLKMNVDLEGPSCDNLFDRYWKIHGFFGYWSQDLWVQLDRDKEGLEAGTIDGKVLQATHFPEETSVKIGHEEAQQLAVKATGKPETEVNTCVLVDASPHPVWIMRLLITCDLLIGIDAETGETVFTEEYYVDETPVYAMYSMPETRYEFERKFSGAAPSPTPQPDGKPWFWGMDYVPRDIWEQAEAFMTANRIDPDDSNKLAEEWDRAFGIIDFWPQEYQAFYSLFVNSERIPDIPDPDYLLFPDPEKIPQKEIEAAALRAVLSLADTKTIKDREDRLKASSTLYSDSRRPDREGEKYGKPVWWVWFHEYDEKQQGWSSIAAYAILDEDGNVLTAGLGEI